MAKQRTEEAFSLFPFLDIMASLIGILVLMITAATLAQIANDEEDTADAQAVERAQARVTEYRVVRKQIVADMEEHEKLQELIEQAEAARQELEKLRAEAARLMAARQKIEELSDPETEKRLEELKSQLVRLRSLLANRKEGAADSDIQIMPSGTGRDLTPTFVECTADAVVLHDRPEPLQIPVGRLSADKNFQSLLDHVKQQPKGTVVFLVRPDGARTYSVARSIARRNYTTNGKLAVAGHGKLDLSLFEKE